MYNKEQEIVETARGRLLVNTREFKELVGIGVVSVGCLARIIHLKQAKAISKTIPCVELAASLDRSEEKERRKDERALPNFTLETPLLVSIGLNGRCVLFDRDQRLKHLLKRAAKTANVVAIEQTTVETFRIAAPVVTNYRTLNLLENWPIGGEPNAFRNATVTQVSYDDEDRQRGGQVLTGESHHLRDTFYYFATRFLDIEWFVYEHLPSEALIDIRKDGINRNDLSRETVGRENIDYLRRSCRTIPSYDTIVNKSPPRH